MRRVWLTFCRSPGARPRRPNSATRSVAHNRAAEAAGQRTAARRVQRLSWVAAHCRFSFFQNAFEAETFDKR
jgi:hypothetical protein